MLRDGDSLQALSNNEDSAKKATYDHRTRWNLEPAHIRIAL